MNWKHLAALILLYLCGVVSGMDIAFKIDAHLAIIQHQERSLPAFSPPLPLSCTHCHCADGSCLCLSCGEGDW